MKALICLSVLTLVTLHCFDVYGQTPKKNDRTAEWEYKQLSSPTDEILNHHAKEGWEIVAAAGGGNDNGIYYNVILKRHKSHALFGTRISDYQKPEPPPQVSTCKLTLAQAPAIRGLRLGMTIEEIFTFFPANQREEIDRAEKLKSAEFPPNYGFTSFGFHISNYPKSDQFTGIYSFNIGLLDRKVVNIQAYYSQTPQYDRMSQLMESITRQFSLPEFKQWPGYNEYWSNPSLTCDGFIFKAGQHGPFLIELTDQTYKKVVEERKQADLAKKREEFKW
ncbi:MAG: hypothetical protein L0220_10315 [Acidobacteria bacterium]|nr:hypothetical protein [Acidobacteriota bacterium]